MQGGDQLAIESRKHIFTESWFVSTSDSAGTAHDAVYPQALWFLDKRPSRSQLIQIMSINPNEDTELWVASFFLKKKDKIEIHLIVSNDALRKHGILPPLEPTPPSPSPPPSPNFDDLLNDFTPSQLQELSEDAPDDDTERLIALHRRQRLAADCKDQDRARFGRVYPIGREDYTREVTDASKIDEEDDDNERGTGVVCLLYKDGQVQHQ